MLLDILLTLHFILLILISLRVLSRHDLTSPARLAWIVVLFVLPYIGVLVYWMFGEVHLGREFTQKRKEIIDRLNNVIRVTRNVGISVIVVLATIAVLITYNTIMLLIIY